MKNEITLNNISVGAYMRHFKDDGTSEYVEFNNAAKEIFECDEVLNSPYWRQDMEDINDANVIKSDKPYIVDYPVYGKDGSIKKWLAFTKNKVVNSSYGIHIVTTIVDETQRKKNEEFIVEQKSIVEAIYTYLPVGVIRLDLSGRVLFANNKIVEIFGLLNPDGIIGKVIFNDPNFPKRIKDNILAFNKDVSFQGKYDFDLIISKDYYETSKNSQIIVKNRYSHILNKSGKITGFLGIVEDITEEEKRKKDVDMMQQNLSLVLENGKMSTWNYDVKNQLFTVVNGLDCTKDNVTYDEHFNSLYFNDYIESTKDSFDSVVMGLKQRGGSVYKTYDPIAKKPIFRKTSYIGITENGEVTNVIGTSHDVTDLYLQQEELIKKSNELNLALEAGDISAWTYDVDKQYFKTLYGKAVAGSGLFLSDVLGLLHPDDREKMERFLNLVISGDSVHEIEIFRFKADDIQGGYRYYDSRIVGTLENGRVTTITGTQKDVTESYLHQLQLEEFNIKTNLINTSCNVVQFDYDFNKKAINTYAENSILPGVDITIEKYLEYVHPDDREKVIKLFNDGVNKKFDKFSINMRLLLPYGGGKYIPVISDGVAVKNADGEIIKYTGIRRDISEWDNLNTQLNEQNTINKLILDNINVGMAYFDIHCNVGWTNFEKGSVILNSLDLKLFISGSPCPYLIDGKCKRKSCIVKKTIRDGKAHDKGVTFKGKRYIETTSSIVNDKIGNHLGVLVKFRDITEKETMNIALAKAKEEAILSNQLLNIILARIPVSLFIKDASNEFKYYIANDQFLSTIGKSASEVIGKTDFEIYDINTAKLFHSYDISLLEGSSSHSNYETQVPIKGVDIYWQVSKSMIRSEDGRYLILGVASDISSITKANIELLEAKKKAEESDNLKSAFLANMSHEIRTPLNAIVGFSDLLTETDDPNDKLEYSKIITTNSDMLLRLIGDILDLSKIESGNIIFKRELMDISTYFDEITTSLSHREVNPKVKFLTDNPYKTCYASIDKERFGQIIANFVTNAIKYTPSGYIKVGYVVENQGIKVYVEDTGIGIPENKKSRVYNRFDKLDSFAQGTGLGLTIVKALSEDSGGKCGFDSVEGKGSTFWSWKPFSDIRFSVADNNIKENKHISMESTNVPLQIKKILVAEDNEGNFVLIRSILKDYSITWATNGADAVEKASKNQYDIILMDIKMPIMNGLEATKEIRSFNKEIPIIAVTANAFNADKEEAIKAGCNGFLPKPIKKADLISIISTCLPAVEQ